MLPRTGGEDLSGILYRFPIYMVVSVEKRSHVAHGLSRVPFTREGAPGLRGRPSSTGRACGAAPPDDATTDGARHAPRSPLRLLLRARMHPRHTRAARTRATRTVRPELDRRGSRCAEAHAGCASSGANASPPRLRLQSGRCRAGVPEVADHADQGAPAHRVTSLGRPSRGRKIASHSLLIMIVLTGRTSFRSARHHPLVILSAAASRSPPTLNPESRAP